MKIIYKVFLNLFGLILNILQIFCVRILKEMEEAKRKKTLLGSLVHNGPDYGCSGPGPTYETLI
jgi:hypothetical protein